MIKRKKSFLTMSGLIALVLLSGCGNETTEEDKGNNQDIEQVEKPVEDANGVENTQTKTDSVDEVADDKTEDVNEASEEEAPEEPVASASPLAAYSNEQIEYARIWLQLGATQEIDELNVEKILEGTPLNNEDEASAVYPEPVVQLSSSRLVEGSITYSSNGDGTINVYPIPKRWEMISSDVEIEIKNGVSIYTQQLLDRKERVSVDIGDDDAVEALIKIQQIQ